MTNASRCEALDDVSQGAKTCINMLGLLQPHPLTRGPPDPLTPRQVNKHQSGLHLLYLLARIRPLVFILVQTILVDVDVKNSVGARRSFVHLLGCHLTILHSSIYNVDRLFHGVDGHFNKVLHKYFSVVFFSDLQILSFVRIQEILNLVLIDLVKTQMNFPLKQRSSLFLLLEYFKDAIY